MTIRVIPRGIPGTARVLKVTRTSQVARCPEAGWHAPWVHRFVLLVSIPGRPLFVARCRAYGPDLVAGATVQVTSNPLWRRRVAIDVSHSPDQLLRGGRAAGGGRMVVATSRW
ncbi:MAG TPA: hypothetical protein VKU39_14940, partial [Streptosporangiaceae bacterium]|nr:hypothetical protein [Streptosporangiaceae bacterium]